MKNKKTLILVLVLSLSFTITSCKDKKEETTSPTEPTVIETQAPETTKPKPKITTFKTEKIEIESIEKELQNKEKFAAIKNLQITDESTADITIIAAVKKGTTKEKADELTTRIADQISDLNIQEEYTLTIKIVEDTKEKTEITTHESGSVIAEQ
ncbi:hypothetical protein [Miniphocaeibacter massiliensis]|uniref:hypothetical protein n=1 Tax=Miniphocaeibacter massiliensis TaxID=2041841 RepID=UPI00101AD554|nr:hypothetical protein [Miniphocaeibacter massiliensis]